MGGNALKHLDVQRVDAQTYFELVVRVQQSFVQEFGVIPHLVQSYKTKPDFGDVDLLVVGQYLPLNWRETFGKLHNSRGSVRNGDVTSLELYDVQFDFINCQENSLHWAQTYFAYNDLGNLMGRVAHKMEFKYGHLGLVYVLRDAHSVIAEINIDATPAQVFEFLGYSYPSWCAGFERLTDIFEYAASTMFFSPDIYLLHNRNAHSRVRDAKRKTYTEFLDWCETHKTELQARAWNWETHTDQNAMMHLHRACCMWPKFKADLGAAYIKSARDEARKQFWNGENVIAWTGLNGRELGQFMMQVKQLPGFETAISDPELLKAFTMAAYDVHHILRQL